MRTPRSPLRRTAMGLAGLSLVAGGSVGLVSVASAEPSPPQVTEAPSVALHNATAEVGTDCPAGGAAYWHFVFAPNDGSAAFQEIVLDLGGATPMTFSGAAIVPNGTQADNVFVAVPAGHALEDLQVAGSYATYTGSTPNLFNLSHVCEGEVPEEETTTTTVRQVEDTTTTTVRPVEDTTTTTRVEEPTTTTTRVEEPTTTTTIEEPVVEDTVVEDTTTTTPDPGDTVVGDTPTTPPGDAPTDQSAAPASPQVATPVATTGTLPYTGSDAAGLAVAGLAVVAGGLVLTAAARSRTSASRR